MRKNFIALVLSAFLIIPYALCAEEVEIQLMEVIEMGYIPGDSPLDNPEQSPDAPPRPRSFRATVNGNTINITKLDNSIPSAHATIVKSTTGNVILNQDFVTSVSCQVPSTGVYMIHIQTESGTVFSGRVVIHVN
jgi:hypothetical protein